MLPNQKSLAELAAAQVQRNIFAFSLGEPLQALERLRKTHAKKVVEINALRELMAETAPDLVLRTADGRELILRLPSDEIICLCCTLYEKLASGVRKLEEQIVEDALEAERQGNEPNPDDLRPAILALCQPVAPAATE